MEETITDWVDCSLFLMIASAEATDHYLDEQEIAVIIEKAEMLVSTFARNKMRYTSHEIERKFKKTFDRYIEIGDAAPQGQMDQMIMDENERCARFLKDQEWFNPTFAQSLIVDLVAIAEADGEVIKNEENSINKIANLWSIKAPY